MQHSSKNFFLFLLIVIIFGNILIISPISAGEVYVEGLQESVKPAAITMNQNGRYETSLFTGAATYSYPINVPPGTNGLTPAVVLTYNSHDALNHNSWVGAGWNLNLNYAKRDVHHIVYDSSDSKDTWDLVLNGQHNTFYRNRTENKYHTEEEAYLDIQRKSTSNNDWKLYYLITTKDGTKYHFGDSMDSEARSTSGTYNTLYDYLTRVQDTHGNTIFYTYVENVSASDSTATYLSKIEYNNDKSLRVDFILENNGIAYPTPIYDQGSKVCYGMRLKEIQVYADNKLVSAYKFSYALNDAGTLLLLKKIQKFGSDGSTSLPPVTFDYENVTPGWTNAPQWETDYGIGGSQGNVISDVNNDGWTDVLKSDKNYNSNGQTTYSHNAYMNTGSRFGGNTTLDDLWHPPQPFAYEIVSTHTFSDEFQLFDANGDGYPDLISNTAAYLNTKSGWSTASSSPWRAPLDIEGKDGIVVSDVNNDGLPDIMKSYRNSSSSPVISDTWLNTGNGWALDTEGYWKPPREFVAGTSGGGIQTKAQIADVNGDGLPDLISSSDCYINNGNGWVTDTAWKSPVSFLGTNGVRIRDVNNDGLPDILLGKGYTDTSGKSQYSYATWLNTGHGWSSNASWAPPDYFIYRYADDSVGEELAAADVNGDGQVDFIDSDNSWIHKGTSFGNRLIKISDEYGGKTTVQYASPIAFPRSGLGLSLQLVKNITRDNGMASTAHHIISKNEYSYEGGLYNYTSNEFRGFAHVTVTDSLNQRYEHYFYQNKELLGREYRSEIFGPTGTLFKKDEQTWTFKLAQKCIKPNASSYYVWLNETTDSLYDGQASPKITKASLLYDNYGNIIRQKMEGDVNVAGDEKFLYNEYVFNTTAWIVNRVKHVFQLDSDNTRKVQEAWFFYDGHLSLDDPPIFGDKTRSESWLSGGVNPVTSSEFDSYGNLVKITDPKGNIHTNRYGLTDPTFTFREEATNPMGHVTRYQYEPGQGNILRITDPNGLFTSFEYDTLGRRVKDIKPYDSSTYPTITYQYYIDGAAPEYIRSSIRELPGTEGTLDSYVFYDGSGQKIQTRSESETPTQMIVSSTFYDQIGRSIKQTVPYYDAGVSYTSPSSMPATITEYDPLNRITRLINPDGTQKLSSYNLWITTATDENGNIIRNSNDAYGRISTVEEVNNGSTYRTTYNYSALDKVTKITDYSGNTFQYNYDTLGQKISQNDPDAGNWTYTYDPNGNIKTQTDARGRTTTFTYDNVNRKLSTDYPTDTDISYLYDDTVKGTLSKVIQGARTVTYSYDQRLRKTAENVAMDGLTWITQYQYDDLDRVKSITYPTGEVIQYNYNNRGLLNDIPGLLTSIKYSELGKITQKNYGNGVSTSLEYYPTDFRLKRILISGKQNLTYTYDSVGNVKSIQDHVKGLVQAFSYDNLNRLITANETGGYGSIQYDYSPIGNLLQKTINGAVITNSYGDGSAGPHALTKQAVIMQSLEPLPGYTIPPTDPDFDGLFEDLNANNRMDFNDVVLMFNLMQWISANEPVSAFDFNGNGRIDFNDIVKLFGEI